MEKTKVSSDLATILRADGAIARARRRSDAELRKRYMRGSVLADLYAWLAVIVTALFKFLPPVVGALIVIAVDPPKTRKELFGRFFVALAFSYLFGRTTLDFLKGFGWFTFLDFTNEEHRAAVLGGLGACGWFVAGGTTQILKKLRDKPLETVEEAKKVML